MKFGDTGFAGRIKQLEPMGREILYVVETGIGTVRVLEQGSSAGHSPGEEVKIKGWIRRVGMGRGGDVTPLGEGVSEVSYKVIDGRDYPLEEKLAAFERPRMSARRLDAAERRPTYPGFLSNERGERVGGSNGASRSGSQRADRGRGPAWAYPPQVA